jgi:DNA-directed RNA polymerase subunit RPC12/RpoP
VDPEELELQGNRFYTIDLTKIKGSGEIKCPKCGTTISPDDKTENTYTIMETVMKDESLDRISLQCNRCQSKISLTGFRLLNKTG